jgi:hypothetical protein
VEPAHRSIHPNIPGVPWWTALLIAITATAIGYAIDAGLGHKELTNVFAGLYIAGCVAAVLAVRQDGVFTAIIQPPLILFCAVPGSYWLFHGRKIGTIKDLLINCGYPLIERFPLMLGTAGAVLLIGLARWYFGMSQRTAVAAETPDDTATAETGDARSFFGEIAAKLHSILRPDIDEDDADDAAAADARRARAASSAPRTRRPARSGGSTAGTRRSRSRHSRPPLDAQEPPIERPRRSSRRSPAPARDYDAYDATEPPRRSRRRRPEADPDLRGQPPREARREPRTRRGSYERPAARSSRFDAYDMYDRPGAPEHFGRYEPQYEPPRRRATNGAGPTHHPISQVRYRGATPDEPRAEGRSRPPTNGRPPAESWEYDV